MTPTRSMEIFQAYLIGISAVTDPARLDRFCVQLLDDPHLTKNQKDALMVVAYNLDRRFRPTHPAYREGT